jgi:hypothetical protein
MTTKEQLFGMLEFISENDAKKMLLFAKETFVLKTKTWEDIEEDEPTPDEITAFKEYRAANVKFLQ